MDPEDRFYCQLAKSIQAWLWVEAEVYFLYLDFMQGANQHLISVTFNHIQSFDSKLALLNSCFALALDAKSAEWKSWRQLRSRAENLNKKRNKIVHEPAILSVEGNQTSIAISPSHFNSLALVQGKTTHKGPVMTPTYKPSGVRILEDHLLDLQKLRALERTFKDFSRELREFREVVAPLLPQRPKRRSEASA